MPEFLLNNLWVIWLAASIVFVVLELMTTALVSIWFVPAALLTAVVSIFFKDLTAQVLLFLVVSAVVLLLSKKVFRRTKSEQLTNANELLVGKIAVVTQEDSGVGARVRIGDVYWRAVSDQTLAQGETVKVIAVNGNTVTVEKQSAVREGE